ncbi:hypothetical protein E2C01_092048 [Portunus trituberculatus]|uniref:Uncharacterized protein n=1 Tax=Portunus trituberculatus TaxID=210409 RepID=A0A5B7JFJ2_PORTR|nr:hypothetical protein [Portunus trituberculatus]
MCPSTERVQEMVMEVVMVVVVVVVVVVVPVIVLRYGEADQGKRSVVYLVIVVVVLGMFREGLGAPLAACVGCVARG